MAKNEWVLITGAANGIGAELCRLFARDGSNLVLVDKNAAGLETMNKELKFMGAQTISLTFDLSQPDSSQQVFDELQTRAIAIDVLVNNAGFGVYGNFWETDLARDQALINLNILAPMMLTKLFLPLMIARGRGRVLNVGSVSGFLASPYAPTYYASKAWLLSFSQGVNSSLQGRGVTVTIVCPGPTYTAFNWHNPDAANVNNANTQSELPPRKRFQMSAQDVAMEAYRGMRRGQSVVIPGTSNKALAVLAKLLPRRFALWLLMFGQKRAN